MIDSNDYVTIRGYKFIDVTHQTTARPMLTFRQAVELTYFKDLKRYVIAYLENSGESPTAL